jgi:hypothetical protein
MAQKHRDADSHDGYLLYKEASLLGILLSNLFQFHSLCELFAKCQVCLQKTKKKKNTILSTYVTKI